MDSFFSWLPTPRTEIENNSTINNAQYEKTVLLKENDEIAIEFINGLPLNIVFPKAVEVKVVSAPQPLKSGSDTNYKEVELENGLKILVPQFIKEGEIVRVNVEDFSYVERVSFKSH